MINKGKAQAQVQVLTDFYSLRLEKLQNLENEVENISKCKFSSKS